MTSSFTLRILAEIKVGLLKSYCKKFLAIEKKRILVLALDGIALNGFSSDPKATKPQAIEEFTSSSYGR